MSEITTDAELAKTVEEAGALLQAIQDYLGRRESTIGKVQFPRGFIRKASDQRMRLRRVRNKTLRKNLSYSLMLWDVYDWVLRRTGLAAIAREMVLKAGIALGGGIAEALLVDYYRGVIGKKQPYKTRTQRLCADGIITDQLRDDLNWLWDVRCKIHLHDIPDSEYSKYRAEDYGRATKAVNALIRCLGTATPLGSIER